jgi:hypothetical protein
VAAAAERSRLLVFDIAEMKAMARGRGVIIMGLEKGESLRAVAVYAGNALVVTGEGRGGKQKTLELSGAKLGHHPHSPIAHHPGSHSRLGKFQCAVARVARCDHLVAAP